MLRLQSDSILVTDSNVFHFWKNSLKRFATVEVEPGESSKSIEVYEKVLCSLIEIGATRETTLVAFGGGVVGDLTGFVAATYMRGVPFVQIPSSLLAMVDSSVGGKVGIDMDSAKNLVGAFKPPSAVYVCPELLNTLPDREFTNGVAEIVKAAFIADQDLLRIVAREKLTKNVSNLEDVIRRSIEIKSAIVESDEFETSGIRATLNFGHTIGHALEQALGYHGILHGEAIAVGMAVETQLGEKLGITPHGLADQVIEILTLQGLPSDLPPEVDPEQILPAMRLDKKRSGSGLAFSLLIGLGECKLVTGISESNVMELLQGK